MSKKQLWHPLAALVTKAVTQFDYGLIDSLPFRADGASHYRAQVPASAICLHATPAWPRRFRRSLLTFNCISEILFVT